MEINLNGFKEIPNFSRYMISRSGDVYSKSRKRILPACSNWSGYQTVTMVDDTGFRSPRKVHRLVYSAWVGPLIDGMVIDHIDDNKLNNDYTNLQQITPSENSIKSFKTGKNADLLVWTDDQISLICEMMEINTPSRQIFENLGIDYDANRIQCNSIIGQLKRGDSHQNIASKYNVKDYVSGINKKDKKLSIADVENIYMRVLFGENRNHLAREYGVKHITICKIMDKRTWRSVTDKLDQYFD